MKRLFLMASLSLAMAACGGSSKKSTTPKTEEVKTAPETPETPETTPPEGAEAGGTGDMEGGGEEPATP